MSTNPKFKVGDLVTPTFERSNFLYLLMMPGQPYVINRIKILISANKTEVKYSTSQVKEGTGVGHGDIPEDEIVPYVEKI